MEISFIDVPFYWTDSCITTTLFWR